VFLIIWEMGGWDFASIPASATQPDEILGAEVDIAQNTPHHANLKGLACRSIAARSTGNLVNQLSRASRLQEKKRGKRRLTGGKPEDLTLELLTPEITRKAKA